MEFAVAVFAFGALLLLAGIVGGDLTFQGARLPKVGRLPRFALTTLGALFIVASAVVWMIDPSDESELPVAARPPAAVTTAPPGDPSGAPDRGRPVRFTVARELAPFHISEEVTLSVDGRRAGIMRLGRGRPSGALEVSASGVGPLPYDVLLVARTPAGDPSTFAGSGAIEPEEGDDLRVELNRSSAGAELVSN